MKKKQTTFLVVLLSAFLLTGCNVLPIPAPSSNSQSSSHNSSSNNQTPSSTPSSSSSNPSSSPSASSSEQNDAQVVPATQPTNDIHTELQYSFLKDDWKNVKTYIPSVNAEDGKRHDDLSVPQGLAIRFPDIANADTYYLQYSKTNDFSNAIVRTTNEKVYYNKIAEVGTTYYYRVSTSQDGLANAQVKTIATADIAPRNVYVPGVINFRDVGGWKSTLVPNGVIKQGLYYRCAKFDSIGAEGKAVLKELGIKLDIDMRDSYSVPTTSPATSSEWPVEILKASVASGSEDGRWEGDHSRDHNIAATYKSIFEAIANADQKPIGLHCTHGADRTGIVSFFLLALCGVDKNDCGRDYVFTRFAGERAVLPTNEVKNWMNKTEAIDAGANATFADKTYKHLHEDFHISIDTLETIREKFVPGYTRPAA